ncbi:hypothetical protein HYALB_00010413 [Hymenoscyphus albidus]|uniref:Uncharacterized protein n=1 Tax=Hymenoscyphus albidus TaxID=595503 RepID=A0A9N9Q2W3_9HELO|nr:hypothetical protein HYALB_00010413 [Hymenoscyphus albidus]
MYDKSCLFNKTIYSTKVYKGIVKPTGENLATFTNINKILQSPTKLSKPFLLNREYHLTTTMCLTWGYFFANCPGRNYRNLKLTDKTILCEAKKANPEKRCKQYDWVNCNVSQYCPTCITELELGPKRTQESPIATLNEEERSEADRALNLDYKSKVDGKLDSNKWIFDNQNKRVHHPDIPHQPPVFPVERPLSMEDYSWLANLERIMHERIWEHWVGTK